MISIALIALIALSVGVLGSPINTEGLAPELGHKPSLMWTTSQAENGERGFTRDSTEPECADTGPGPNDDAENEDKASKFCRDMMNESGEEPKTYAGSLHADTGHSLGLSPAGSARIDAQGLPSSMNDLGSTVDSAPLLNANSLVPVHDKIARDEGDVNLECHDPDALRGWTYGAALDVEDFCTTFDGTRFDLGVCSSQTAIS